MSDYYCHNCAKSLGLLRNVYTSNLMVSEYQLEKYIKHSIPSQDYPYHSVFDNSSTDVYRNYVINASCSGSVEIDNKGRRNIVWIAGRKVGAFFKNGKLHLPHDAVKVALSSERDKIHAFTESSTKFSTFLCKRCHTPVVA